MNLQSLDHFCLWLERTSLSQAIAKAGWVVPAVQTVHILAIALVVSSALMIDLRLIGVFGRDQSLDRISARFLPFIWWPLLVLLATGVIMITGEPARSLKNPVFQLKVVLIIAAMIVIWIFQILRKNPRFGDLAHGPRVAPRLLAIVSVALWAAIIFAGRWIAYV